MLSFFKNNITTNIFFLLLLFLPNNLVGTTAQIIIMVTLFIATFQQGAFRIKQLTLIKLIFCVWIVIVAMYTLLAHYPFYFQSVIKLVSITLLIVFFPLAIKNRINTNALLIASVFIFFTQLSYIFGVTFIVDFINSYYTAEDYFNSSEVVAVSTELRDIFNLRFGGIFRNSNQAGRIYNLLYAMLLLNTTYGDKKKKIIFFTSGVIFLGIVLTGSRTAFSIFSLLSLFYFLFFLRKYRKTILVASLLLLIPFFLFVGTSNRILNFSELRGNSNSGSLITKIDFLKTYLDYANRKSPTDIYFGTFNIDNIKYYFGERINKFDSEIGYMIHSIGIVGLMLIFIFYILLFSKGDLRTKFVMILLIWTITSTVLTNFRFSLLYFFVLSSYFGIKKESISKGNFL